MHGVLATGPVGEGNDDILLLHVVLHAQKVAVRMHVHMKYLHRVMLAIAPGVALDATHGFFFQHHAMDVFVIAAIDKHMTMGEELHLLGNLLVTREEILIVGLADIGEDAYGGLHHVAQMLHLPRLADADLKESNLVFGIHLPHTKRHADQRGVAFGAGDDTCRTQPSHPIFDDGFAVTRDADTEIN